MKARGTGAEVVEENNTLSLLKSENENSTVDCSEAAEMEKADFSGVILVKTVNNRRLYEKYKNLIFSKSFFRESVHMWTP